MPPLLKPSAVRKNYKNRGLCATEDAVQKSLLPILQNNGVPSRTVRTVSELRQFMADCCTLWEREDLLARLPRLTQQ